MAGIADWLVTTTDERGIDADLAAIDVYMTSAWPKTTRATKLQDEWKVWFNKLDFYARHVEPGLENIYNEARNRRNEFNIANAVSEEQKQAVANVIHTGVTSEEQHGGTKQISSTGKFHVDEKPLIPEWLWWAAAAGLGVIVVASSYGFGIAAPAALLARVTSVPHRREPA